MKKLFILLLVSVSAFAQDYRVKGSVKDSQNEWVPGATVKLISAADSAFLKGTATDVSGGFLISQIPAGTYFLKISGVSYKEFNGLHFTLNEEQPNLELPTIFLLPDKEIALNEVVVKARKPLLEEQIDRTVVNVEAMTAAPALNTLEVLKRTPGVQVENNGSVTLNGKQGVLLLIDGRSTYLSGSDMAAYLKSLPGSVLEKLELMDNPPARYDAAGGAVINIILKKNKVMGLTGNLALNGSMGQLPRSNNSLNTNYKIGKINLFSNLSYNYDQQFTDQTFERKLYNENGDLQTAFTGANYTEYKLNGFSGRLGMDLFASDKTVLGVQLFAQSRPLSQEETFENISSGLENQTIRGTNSSDNTWNMKGVNVNINQKLDDKGQELTADLNYINYRAGVLKNFESNSADELFQRFDNEISGDIDIYSLKADYSLPLTKGSRLDMGIKSSYVKNDNDAAFFTFQNEQPQEDYSRSNHFIYNENLNAAYVNYLRPLGKKLTAQVGIRAENTNLLGELMANEVLTGERFTQNFTNVFPTLFFNYKFGKDNKQTLGANYSKRINRPNYQQFNPFLNYVDAYTYTQGNTTVKPFFLNNYRLTYSYGQFYRAGFGYTSADGILGDISIRRGDIFIRKPYNVGTGFQLFLSQNVSLKPAKFWNSNINFTVARFQIDGKADGTTGAAKFYSTRLNVNNQFTFGKGWSGDFSVYFRGADYFFPVATLSNLRFYAAIQKKVLKDKGSIRLNLDDITYGDITREVTENFQNAYQFRKLKYDTRRAGITFTYNFGDQKYARKRRHQDNATQEEQGRVQ